MLVKTAQKASSTSCSQQLRDLACSCPRLPWRQSAPA